MSDHVDGPQSIGDPTADVTDLFAFRHRVVNPSKELSTMHAIRKLRESGHATAADYEKILAANVVFSQSSVDTGHRRSCGSCKDLRDLDHATRRCLYG